ncbi:MAG: CRISPR-associated DxTHG motif protein [Chloroflexi bacterium]|nr:CRISPR-associated DxTHG motif protein [Chloroflexota bacterium]
MICWRVWPLPHADRGRNSKGHLIRPPTHGIRSLPTMTRTTDRVLR